MEPKARDIVLKGRGIVLPEIPVEGEDGVDLLTNIGSDGFAVAYGGSWYLLVQSQGGLQIVQVAETKSLHAALRRFQEWVTRPLLLESCDRVRDGWFLPNGQPNPQRDAATETACMKCHSCREVLNLQKRMLEETLRKVPDEVL